MTDDTLTRMIRAETDRQTWLADRATQRELAVDVVVERVRSMGYARPAPEKRTTP